MKKVILVILVFGLSAFQVNAQGNTSVVHSKENIEECNYLIHYRDTTLLKVWDKTVNDYKIPKEAIVNLDKLKKELDDDTWYGTTNFHTLTLTLKLASNAIRDMIKIVAPLQSIAYTVTGTWVDKAQMVAKILKEVNSKKEILASEEVEKTLAIDAAKEIAALTPFMSIPVLLNNFSDNLHKANDYLNVKTEVNLQMANFDKAIKNYNNKVVGAQSNIAEVNEYKSYIDDYLKKNCGNLPASTLSASRKSVEKEMDNTPLLATYKDEVDQWVAIGPYMTTEGFATEQQAINSLFYSMADLTLLTDKGKYTIYKLNVKVEHDARDVRSILKGLGVESIPNK